MLRTIFARYGLSSTLVSDNETCFTSQEFEDFLKVNGIQHIKTAPYHPQSNGLAERMVQTFKKGMKKISSGTVDTKLAQFLFSYRITPHSTTGQSPAELMFGRQLRTRFDLLHPNVQEKVVKKQDKQKEYFDRSAKERKFSRGDDVYIRNFSQGTKVKWIPGVIVEQIGRVVFRVRLQNSTTIVKRHKNQIRARISDNIPELEVTLQTSTQVESSDSRQELEPRVSTGPRYPSRVRRPPQRFAHELFD